MWGVFLISVMCLKYLRLFHGFERSDVKTLSFNVDTRYESYQTKDRSWKERFVGYEFKHVMKVEFDSDNARLGKCKIIFNM